MNNVAHGCGGGDSPFCHFHPRELVVGVCAHCLRERLLILLASKQTTSPADGPAYRPLRRKTGSISLPKVFALGSSFLQRLDSSRHHRPDVDANSDADDTTSVASLDDSFISIKFEDNGKATWDSHQLKAAAAAAAAPPVATKVDIDKAATVTAVVEHVKRGGVTRWRKLVVGRLLQLARWKRSGKAGSAAACQLGLDGKKAAERSKGRGRGRSWIRSLTRRRAS
ncbi:hypothetical protein GUJ93_ZPchr0004g39200 [Zizania palustris]|nr:hypothetical protein GUJ93_ZPchr0004g39200 [Zizania palustris]KAG8066831.1 hypothetical protein GUJ93_ZPchr0004g39200 [Zizania palustris]